MVGVCFITSIVIVTLVDDLLLPNFVIPGDTEALAADMAAIGSLFGFAVAGYLLVLLLDTLIGLGVYLVLKPANEKLALLVASLRILYAGIVAVGLAALSLQLVGVHGYSVIKLFGYACFAMHLFALGCASLASGYIPKTIGILLLVASLTYVVFFVELQLPTFLELTIMLTMAGAELSLCLWLLIYRHRLPTSSK